MVSGHDQGVSYDVNVQYSTHPQKGSVISLCFQNCFYPNTFNSSVYTVAMERSLPDGRDDGVWGFLLSAYLCISLAACLAYVNRMAW